MKYFTRERLEIDQIIGWLSVDKTTFCDLEKHFCDEGIDIEEHFNKENELLKKYLPKNLEKIDNIRDAIYLNKYDETTNSYLETELEKWKNDIELENSNNERIYSQYLASIKLLLHESVREFAETSLHDARLLAVNRVNSSTVTFELDCSECCPPGGMCKITFNGVKLFNISDYALPKCWLFKEIELVDCNCFKLQVLFDNGECELIAEDLVHSA